MQVFFFCFHQVLTTNKQQINWTMFKLFHLNILLFGMIHLLRLLFIISLYVFQSTREAKELMKPLYDRYRNVKKLLVRLVS